MLLIARINDFASEIFAIDDDETADEILRRSKTDAYYLESVKVFEKAFAIDRLDKILEKI